MKYFSQTSYLFPLLAIIMGTILIQSCQNPSNKEADSNTHAILFVWNTSDFPSFWKIYEREVFPKIKHLYSKGDIKYAFPFEHKPLQYPEMNGQWTNSVLIGLDSRMYKQISTILLDVMKKSELSKELVAADLLRLQKGLDMFYSVENGIEEEDQLEQILEYVFSDSLAREKYYGEQYVFSGPAMQELHQNNNAGRFIGFEVEGRIYGVDFPAWDLIHVVGFTKEQTERATPIFMDVWNKHAEKAFGEGMTFIKKKKEWDKIRVNIKSDASQLMNYTLPLKQLGND